ncbi:hypothetical protein SOM61_12660, partial [Massilia sp. CFBP9012]|uniref:hypothetical protein n=1 Tax=Massilia sp. CFBP9012 TaxID=3096531 RepID=UPI002A6ADDF8
FDNLSNQEPKFLAPSSNAHTYRLLIFKELYPALLHLPFASNRFVRQQQRNEIMLVLLSFVNTLFFSFVTKRRRYGGNR